MPFPVRTMVRTTVFWYTCTAYFKSGPPYIIDGDNLTTQDGDILSSGAAADRYVQQKRHISVV